MTSLLERGELPIEDLATLAYREGLRPRPIYQAHKWFARRFGTAFRALLTGAIAEGDDFWTAYYEGADWSGKTVLDPFVGGGTSIIEAQRLGANVIGVDVDPVACAITRFETQLAEMPDLEPALQRLKQEVGKQLSPWYCATADDGTAYEVLHFFWVQIVPCRGCGEVVEAHPHFQLAYDAQGTEQWAFCPTCHTPQQLSRWATEMTCPLCDVTVALGSRPVQHGRLTCSNCGTTERLIDVSVRTGRPPVWRLFATEVLAPDAERTRRSVPLTKRLFRAATDADQSLFLRVQQELQDRTSPIGKIAWIPDRAIPAADRSDDRLIRYGYTHYHELFNARQLLHLSILAEAIHGFAGSEREALAIAFSDHLTTNCMMTAYAFGWRRATPLFSIRAYRHIPRPVEINPWLDGTGRGTFPNAIRQVQRASAFARTPQEPTLDGSFRRVIDPRSRLEGHSSVRVLHGNSQSLPDISSNSVDLVLTDPPYFDNIAYSELSDFFLPWLQMLGLAPIDGDGPHAYIENLAGKRRDEEALQTFRQGLIACFIELSRVLKDDGRLVFTYQHKTPGAWEALGSALARGGLRPIHIFPMLGNARGLHSHAGTSTWDAVFVAVKGIPQELPVTIGCDAIAAADRHAGAWIDRLQARDFRAPDFAIFRAASLIGAALGLFFEVECAAHDRLLIEILEDVLVVPPAGAD